MRADYPNQLDYEGLSRLRESNSRPPAYKAGAITTMLKRQWSGEKPTSARFELTRAEPSRFRIYRLNHSAKMPSHEDKKWRIRVSIPVPRRCKRRTLPIELIPHGLTKSDPGRTRTCNRLIRSQARYPLRHRANRWGKTGSSGIRTHAFR